MKIKRKPTLADRVIGHKTSTSDVPKFMRQSVRFDPEKMRTRVTLAKRFVLDKAASRILGEICRDAPEAIAYAQEFAIPPFPLMWVELDARELFTVVARDDIAAGLGDPLDPDADATLGFLYDGPTVYSVVCTDNIKSGIGIMPYVYRLNQPADPEFEGATAAMMGLSRIGLDAFYWGSALPSLQAHDPSMIRALRASHTIDLGVKDWRKVLEDPGQLAALRKATATFVDGAGGDLRNVIAILLLLNRTSDYTYVDVPIEKGHMIGRTPRALTSYRSIKIHLSPVKKIIRQGKRQGAAWKRRHDVRGHFCRNKLARLAEQSFGVCKGVTHDWNEIDVNQWGCLKCGGLKWWKVPHERGHFMGAVDAKYEVTA